VFPEFDTIFWISYTKNEKSKAYYETFLDFNDIFGSALLII